MLYALLITLSLWLGWQYYVYYNSYLITLELLHEAESQLIYFRKELKNAEEQIVAVHESYNGYADER